MANDLQSLREKLLQLDHPDKIIRLADQYLTMFETMGDSFVLPKEHLVVKPILEYYAGDLAGWLKFVKGVRDRLPPKSTEFVAVQAFYRTLEVRKVQQERRDRISQAVNNALAAGAIEDTSLSKQRYARRVVQAWSLRRYAAMDEARDRGVRARLTTEERSEILERFWQEVDEELAQGGYPKP